jgi:hypothetical protein
MAWALRDFALSGPQESSADLDPKCMLDLIDLPETGTVDWYALWFGCREPFYRSSMKARLKKKTSTRKTSGRQVARAA